MDMPATAPTRATAPITRDAALALLQAARAAARELGFEVAA